MSTTIGIIGGTGMLGSAITRGLLASGKVQPDDLLISNRSGDPGYLEGVQDLGFALDNQELADDCDLIILCVPPALARDIDLDMPDKPFLSVMAGVTLDLLSEITGSQRVVRAMSSPAASLRLAYSPWCAAKAVTDDDKTLVRMVLEAIGTEDEISDEQQIDIFTAMTGPVPGFAALYADCMVSYAKDHGVDLKIAERAVRQLFAASGAMLSEGPPAPADHVREMIDYAGTTAAGLKAMQEAGIQDAINKGLDAAVGASRQIAGDAP